MKFIVCYNPKLNQLGIVTYLNKMWVLNTNPYGNNLIYRARKIKSAKESDWHGIGYL